VLFADQDDPDAFFQAIYSNKRKELGSSALAICQEMRFPPENLFPRSRAEFIKDVANSTSTAAHPDHQERLAETKYQHYTKRRNQALMIIQMRMIEKRRLSNALQVKTEAKAGKK
jgi:SOS-response transcriptional repressor LexA